MICSFLYEAQPFLFSKQISSIPFPLPHRDNTCRFFSAIHKSEFLSLQTGALTCILTCISKSFTVSFNKDYVVGVERGGGQEGREKGKDRHDQIPSPLNTASSRTISWSSPGISRPTGNRKDIIRKRVAVRTYTCHGNQVLEKTD